MSVDNTAIVILAAGLGTRMKSSTPKVFHKVFDRPMLSRVVDAASGMKPSRIVVVINKSMRDSIESMGMPSIVSTAIQASQNGTAHALRSALPSLKGFKGTVVILNGDTPLITSSTLRKFLSRHKKSGRKISVLSFSASDPTGYGRILRSSGKSGEPLGIIEEGDADAEQKRLTEVNSGVYAIETSALSLLDRIQKNRKKKEFYLTDIVDHAINDGQKVGVYPIGSEEEFIGVNSRQDLMDAHEILRLRVIEDMLSKGVTFIDAYSTYVSPEVRIGRDTVIYPNVFIHGNTVIGKGCTIYPNSRLIDSRLKDGVIIKDSSLVDGSEVGPDAQIGPMAHLRPGTFIGKNARIGNFVEVKKSSIGSNTKAAHLAYVGDSDVGADTNLGAGTITCNYDGKNKFPTKIGKGVFIGSDTQLVAPVTVGDGAYVGAGSTITRDVEPGALAVSRTKQKNYPKYRGGKKS